MLAGLVVCLGRVAQHGDRERGGSEPGGAVQGRQADDEDRAGVRGGVGFDVAERALVFVRRVGDLDCGFGGDLEAG